MCESRQSSEEQRNEADQSLYGQYPDRCEMVGYLVSRYPKRCFLVFLIITVFAASYALLFPSIGTRVGGDLISAAQSPKDAGLNASSHVPIQVARVDGRNLAYPVLRGSKVTLSVLGEDSGVYDMIDNLGGDGGAVQADHSIAGEGRTKGWAVSAADLPAQVRNLPPGTPVAIWPAYPTKH
jgi:hypothetical protein